MTQTKPRHRRRLQRGGRVGGFDVATIKSRSRNDGTKHETHVCPHTGECSCSCEHFYYRLQKHNPTIWTPEFWCNHLKRHIEAMQRGAELAEAQQRPCCGCGVADAEHEAFDECGRVQVGFICEGCVQRARAPQHAPCGLTRTVDLVEESLRLEKAIKTLERWRSDAMVPGYASWGAEEEFELEQARDRLDELEAELESLIEAETD